MCACACPCACACARIRLTGLAAARVAAAAMRLGLLRTGLQPCTAEVMEKNAVLCMDVGPFLADGDGDGDGA